MEARREDWLDCPFAGTAWDEEQRELARRAAAEDITRKWSPPQGDTWFPGEPLPL